MKKPLDTRRFPARRAGTLVLLFTFGLAVLGCGGEPPYDHVYTFRARVHSLPDDRPTSEFMVHHETIPEYVSINGSIGMRSMVMGLNVPDPAVLEGLAVGDAVEITYGETFEPKIRTGVISIKKLPADTVLEFDTPAGPQPNAEGFVPIFDGKTLDGWGGDPVYWSVRDGRLVGEITPETIVDRNTFIIWRGGEPADFELKLDYRITPGGNSGIQYRSVEIEGEPYVMRGYQADIENGPNWTGQNYDERGRTFLARRGQSVVVKTGEPPRVVEQFGDAEELNKLVNFEGWNSYHLVVKGSRMIHYVNGTRMSEVLDNDVDSRAMSGLLGLQVHVGPPMKVEFRDIRLKELAVSE